MIEPTDQFRGWFIPVSIVRLYDSGEITDAEVLLLSKIDALQDPKRGGCWATNRWLAEWWRKTPDWVSKTIAKFIRLKLVKSSNTPRGLRILKTHFAPIGLQSYPPRSILLPPSDDNPTPSKRERKIEKEKEGIQPASAGLKTPAFNFTEPEVNNYTKELSPAIKQYADFSRKRKFHVFSRNGKTGYSKGGQSGGWSRQTLLWWEKEYQTLASVYPPDQIQQTLDRFLAYYDSNYAPIAQTFPIFSQKYAAIQKFVQREQKIRSQNGLEEDNQPELEGVEDEEEIVTRKKDSATRMTREEQEAFQKEIDGDWGQE
jgi:hypothetical protein